MKIERISNTRNVPFQNSHPREEFPIPHSLVSDRPGLDSDGQPNAGNDEESGGDASGHAQVAALFEDEALNGREDANDTLEQWLERIQHARRLDLRL